MKSGCAPPVGAAEGYWRDGKPIPLVNDEGWFVTRSRRAEPRVRLTIAGLPYQPVLSGGRRHSAGGSRTRY